MKYKRGKVREKSREGLEKRQSVGQETQKMRDFQVKNSRKLGREIKEKIGKREGGEKTRKK